MGLPARRGVLIRQACVAALSAAVFSGVVIALVWGLLSGEAFGTSPYQPAEQTEQARYETWLRATAIQWGRQDGWLSARRAAPAELDELLSEGSFESGWEIGYDYSWNRAVDLALEKSSRQSYASEPGTQWIELRR